MDISGRSQDSPFYNFQLVHTSYIMFDIKKVILLDDLTFYPVIRKQSLLYQTLNFNQVAWKKHIFYLMELGSACIIPNVYCIGQVGKP